MRPKESSQLPAKGTATKAPPASGEANVKFQSDGQDKGHRYGSGDGSGKTTPPKG